MRARPWPTSCSGSAAGAWGSAVEHYITKFVAHPEKLADAEVMYARRLARIDPALARVVHVDGRAQPSDDASTLWELRDVALYEDLERVMDLELFQISCVLDVDAGLTQGQEDTLNQHLFFADADQADPFPAALERVPASEVWAALDPIPAEVEEHQPPTLTAGTWLVTAYALISRDADPAAEFGELTGNLKVLHFGEITEVDPHDTAFTRFFGPLILRQSRLLLDGASRHLDYPLGRWRLRQASVVKHAGAALPLSGNDERPAVFTAERLN